MEGRLGKIRKEKALLEQPFIKDTSKTVAEHIKSVVASLGENIQVVPDPVLAAVCPSRWCFCLQLCQHLLVSSTASV